MSKTDSTHGTGAIAAQAARRRLWGLIAVLAVVAGAIGAVVCGLIGHGTVAPVYTAVGSAVILDGSPDLEAHVELFQSPAVLDGAMARTWSALGRSNTPEDRSLYQKRLSVRPDGQSIEIMYWDNEAQATSTAVANILESFQAAYETAHEARHAATLETVRDQVATQTEQLDELNLRIESLVDTKGADELAALRDAKLQHVVMLGELLAEANTALDAAVDAQQKKTLAEAAAAEQAERRAAAEAEAEAAKPVAKPVAATPVFGAADPLMRAMIVREQRPAVRVRRTKPDAAPAAAPQIDEQAIVAPLNSAIASYDQLVKSHTQISGSDDWQPLADASVEPLQSMTERLRARRQAEQTEAAELKQRQVQTLEQHEQLMRQLNEEAASARQDLDRMWSQIEAAEATTDQVPSIRVVSPQEPPTVCTNQACRTQLGTIGAAAGFVVPLLVVLGVGAVKVRRMG